MTAAVATGAAESCCASCAKSLPCETGCARHGEPQVGEDFATPQDAIQSALSKGFTHSDLGPDYEGYVYRSNDDGSTRVSRLYFHKGKYHFDYPHELSRPMPASARPLVEHRMAAEQPAVSADQLQWHDAGNFYFARVPGGDYTISKVPGVHHLAWQPHGGRAVALGFFPSPEAAQAEAVRHYHTLRAAPVYLAAEARGYKSAGSVRVGDRLRDDDGSSVRVIEVGGAPHGRVHVTVERANGRQVSWNAAPDDQLQLAEEMKLGIEPAAEDYLAVDATGKTVGGPFKSLSDAKDLAQRHGGYVKFVTGEPVAGEQLRTSSYPYGPPGHGITVQLSQGERGLWYARAIAPNRRELVVTGPTEGDARREIEFQIAQLWGIPQAASPLAASERAPVCRPFIRVEKDVQAFNACMELAAKLGPIEGHDRLYEIVRQQMEREDQEVFYAVLLDTQLQLKWMQEIARGARDRVPTPMDDVARSVVASSTHLTAYFGAKGLAVAHCHPSGKPDPSDADREVTNAVRQVCEAMNVLFVDHIVVGRSSYYSFAKERVFRPRRSL